jgi:hypothetical protein
LKELTVVKCDDHSKIAGKEFLLVGKKSGSQMAITSQELRLLLDEDNRCILPLQTHRIVPRVEDGDFGLARIEPEQIMNEGILLLWYRSRSDAREASECLARLAQTHFPPVTITIELAYLPALEMNYCLAILHYDIFQCQIENWLNSLVYRPREQEIEQGGLALKFYREEAQVEQSLTLSGGETPRAAADLIKGVLQLSNG